MESLESSDSETLSSPSSSRSSTIERLNFIYQRSIPWHYTIEKSPAESNHDDYVAESKTISFIKETINHPKSSRRGKRRFSVYMIFNLIVLEITITVFLLLFGYRNYTETNESRHLVHNKLITQRIPLLLDFSSNDTLHASRILSKCLNLTSAPIEKYQVKSTYLYIMPLPSTNRRIYLEKPPKCRLLHRKLIMRFVTANKNA